MNSAEKKTMLMICICVCALFCGACEEHFTGMGPRPGYIEDEPFSPRLNVLGILRPDSIDGFPASFVYLEQSVDILDDRDTIIVSNARVTITPLASEQDSLVLEYTEAGTLFSFDAYRHEQLVPKPGRAYRIACHAPGLPAISERITIPGPVTVAEESISVSGQTLDFTIKRADDALLYDIYLFLENAQLPLYTRVRRPATGNVQISLESDQPLTGSALLEIFTYDKHLAEYFSYNVGVKPNTFRADYSTVENGYGCIGGMNVLKREIYF